MTRRPDPSDRYGGPSIRDELLTRRQLEVVQTYVRAGSMKVAALELGVAQRTIEETMGRARARAQVQTTAQLVRHLARRGELEP